MLTIIQLPVLSDNYIYLIHDQVSGETAVVDPAITDPVLETLTDNGWSLTFILNTHHHWDHVGANLELKEKTGCKVIASHYDRDRIPGIDSFVTEDDIFNLGQHQATIIETPGHTLGHIVYHFKDDDALFCGDTLFVMGCGRLFEGTAEQMFKSLDKLKRLPAKTRIYCAHEYTQTNGQFALSVEPDNQELKKIMEEVNRLRETGQPTVPSTIKQELRTNPFFRSDSLSLQKVLNMENRSPADVFAETRKRKDNF